MRMSKPPKRCYGAINQSLHLIGIAHVGRHRLEAVAAGESITGVSQSRGVARADHYVGAPIEKR